MIFYRCNSNIILFITSQNKKEWSVRQTFCILSEDENVRIIFIIFTDLNNFFLCKRAPSLGALGHRSNWFK